MVNGGKGAVAEKASEPHGTDKVDSTVPGDGNNDTETPGVAGIGAVTVNVLDWSKVAVVDIRCDAKEDGAHRHRSEYESSRKGP